MKTIADSFAEFYVNKPVDKRLVIYEDEKRYFPMDDFDRFLKSIPVDIPVPAVRPSSFLRDVPELVTLYWGYKQHNEEKNGGEFNLHHLLNALISNVVEPGVANAYPHSSSLRWIDSHPHTGDGVMIMCDMAKWPDWEHMDLLIADENGQLHALTIQYKAYVELTYVTKGFYNWQYLFVNTQSMESATKKYLMGNYFLPMRTVLPELFPGVDYSVLFNAIDQF